MIRFGWPSGVRCYVLVALAAPCLAACWVVPEKSKPELHLGGEIASMYVYRGMPMNRNGVVQGKLEGTLPTKWGDTLAAGVFANLDLSNSTGDAWFSDGHGGRVTQFDITGSYAHSFGAIETLVGLQSYNFPFGDSFPIGPRESTHDVFVRAGGDVLGARPEVHFHYDFDQANGAYVRFVLGEEFEIGDAWAIGVKAHVGWSSSGQSFWNYGIRDSGWADLQGTASVLWKIDENTILGANFNGSTIIDSAISAWFDQINIPENNAWVGFFVNWTY